MTVFQYGQNKDYADIGPFGALIQRYPPTDPVPTELFTEVPEGSLMALIYAKALNKWNNHLHEQIRVEGVEGLSGEFRCIGVIEVKNRKRIGYAAILAR